MNRKDLDTFAARKDDEIAAFSVVETAALEANIGLANAADARVEAAQKVHDEKWVARDAEQAAAVAEVQAKLDAAQAQLADRDAAIEIANAQISALIDKHAAESKAANAQIADLLNKYDPEIKAEAKLAAIAKAHADKLAAIGAEAAAVAAKVQAEKDLADLEVESIVPIEMVKS